MPVNTNIAIGNSGIRCVTIAVRGRDAVGPTTRKARAAFLWSSNLIGRSGVSGTRPPGPQTSSLLACSSVTRGPHHCGAPMSWLLPKPMIIKPAMNMPPICRRRRGMGPLMTVNRPYAIPHGITTDGYSAA